MLSVSLPLLANVLMNMEPCVYEHSYRLALLNLSDSSQGITTNIWRVSLSKAEWRALGLEDDHRCDGPIRRRKWWVDLYTSAPYYQLTGIDGVVKGAIFYKKKTIFPFLMSLLTWVAAAHQSLHYNSQTLQIHGHMRT